MVECTLAQNVKIELLDANYLWKFVSGSSRPGSVLTNLASIHEDTGFIPGLAQWAKDPALPRCSRRCGLDLAWLWLWCRPAATAPLQPLAWELPYATSAVLKKKERKFVSKLNRFVLFIAFVCSCCASAFWILGCEVVVPWAWEMRPDWHFPTPLLF